MSAEAMITTLKSLKLFGMTGAIDALAIQKAPAYQQAVDVLEGLIKAEVAEREVRSVNYQMKIARFPAHRDLTGFDFSESTVNEPLIRSLHRLTHHCHIIETGNDSYRFKNSTTNQTREGKTRKKNQS